MKKASSLFSSLYSCKDNFNGLTKHVWIYYGTSINSSCVFFNSLLQILTKAFHWQFFFKNVPLPISPLSDTIFQSTVPSVPSQFAIRISMLSLVVTAVGHLSSSLGGMMTLTSVWMEVTSAPANRVTLTLYFPGRAYLWDAEALVVFSNGVRSPKSHNKVLTETEILIFSLASSWMLKVPSCVKYAENSTMKACCATVQRQSLMTRWSEQAAEHWDSLIRLGSKFVPHRHSFFVPRPPYGWCVLKQSALQEFLVKFPDVNDENITSSFLPVCFSNKQAA